MANTCLARCNRQRANLTRSPTPFIVSSSRNSPQLQLRRTVAPEFGSKWMKKSEINRGIKSRCISGRVCGDGAPTLADITRMEAFSSGAECLFPRFPDRLNSVSHRRCKRSGDTCPASVSVLRFTFPPSQAINGAAQTKPRDNTACLCVRASTAGALNKTVFSWKRLEVKLPLPHRCLQRREPSVAEGLRGEWEALMQTLRKLKTERNVFI